MLGANLYFLCVQIHKGIMSFMEVNWCIEAEQAGGGGGGIGI